MNAWDATLVATNGTPVRDRPRRLRDVWADLLPIAVSGQPAAVQRISGTLEYRASWKTFHRYVDELLLAESNQPTRGMRRLCNAVGLTVKLQDEFRQSNDPLERALAARTLVRLRERVAPEALLHLLESGDPATVLITAEAIALLREPELFMPVLRALRERTPATLAEVTSVLRLFGEDVCPTAHGLLKGVLRQHIDAEATESPDPIDPDTEIDRNDAAAHIVIADLLASHEYTCAVPTYKRLLGVCTNERVRHHLMKAIAATGEGREASAGLKTAAA